MPHSQADSGSSRRSGTMSSYHVAPSFSPVFLPQVYRLAQVPPNKQQKFASGLSYPSDASSFPSSVSKVVPTGCFHLCKDVSPAVELTLHSRAFLNVASTQMENHLPPSPPSGRCDLAQCFFTLCNIYWLSPRFQKKCMF